LVLVSDITGLVPTRVSIFHCEEPEQLLVNFLCFCERGAMHIKLLWGGLKKQTAQNFCVTSRL